MRIILQRCSRAEVRIDGQTVGKIGQGFMLQVETGRFGADMKVDFINDGPVTIVLDTTELLITLNSQT